MSKMSKIMYDIPSIYLVGILLLAMLLAMAIGHYFGARRAQQATEEFRSQTTAVQGSLLGILALLLGFTFSLALSRHDARMVAVVDEANAIGTAWLRTDFLPEAEQASMRDDLRRYLQLRIEGSAVTVNHSDKRLQVAAQAQAVFDKLWAQASKVIRDQGGPSAVSFGTSLNDMIDAFGTRNASIERHVPGTVLYLMFVTFILSGAMLGYGSGVAGSRPATPVYLMMALIVLLVFMIIDLDRPRRGWVEVDQTPMFDLYKSIQQS